jgi:hypothetical protein
MSLLVLRLQPSPAQGAHAETSLELLGQVALVAGVALIRAGDALVAFLSAIRPVTPCAPIVPDDFVRESYCVDLKLSNERCYTGVQCTFKWDTVRQGKTKLSTF